MKMIFAAVFMMIVLVTPALAAGHPRHHAEAHHPMPHHHVGHHAGHHKR